MKIFYIFITLKSKYKLNYYFMKTSLVLLLLFNFSIQSSQECFDSNENNNSIFLLDASSIEDSSQPAEENSTTLYYQGDLSDIEKKIKADAFNILACNAKPANGGSGSRMVSTSLPNLTVTSSSIIFNGTYTASNWLSYSGTYEGVLNEYGTYTSFSFRLDSGLKSGSVSSNCL